MSAKKAKRDGATTRGKSPNDPIYILINGEPVVTYLDAQGVQRLPLGDAINELFLSGALDLNKLAIAVKRDRTVSMDTQRWVYLQLGYSVTGYAEIFPKDKIINPLWK